MKKKFMLCLPLFLIGGSLMAQGAAGSASPISLEPIWDLVYYHYFPWPFGVFDWGCFIISHLLGMLACYQIATALKTKVVFYTILGLFFPACVLSVLVLFAFPIKKDDKKE